MLYQKDMKATLKAIGTRDYRTKVDLIHKTLYSFSYINLHHLFVKSPPFRFLLDLSFKKKKEIFKYSKEDANFEEGDNSENDVEDSDLPLSEAKKNEKS